MGFWKSKRGICGDSWADELDNCMEKLARLRVEYIEPIPRLANIGLDNKEGEHEITMQEFADLVEFCSRGHLIVELRNPDKDASRPLSQLHEDKSSETYNNHGQIQGEEK